MLDPRLAALSGGVMSIIEVIAILLVAYFVVMWIAAVIWTYRDVTARTADRQVQMLATALVAVFSLPGLLLYLAIRPPEQLVETYNRQLEAEALLHEIEKEHRCPHCRRGIQDGFIACPHCRTRLQEPCARCAQSLRQSWVLCPYCGAERQPAAAASTRGIAAPAWRNGDRAAAALDGTRPPERRSPVARPAS